MMRSSAAESATGGVHGVDTADLQSGGLLLITPAAPAPAPYPVTPCYYVPQPYLPPMQSHVEERPRYGLVITGLAIFGGVYIWNLMAAMMADDWRPAIPIIGPFILMADRKLDGA